MICVCVSVLMTVSESLPILHRHSIVGHNSWLQHLNTVRWRCHHLPLVFFCCFFFNRRLLRLNYVRHFDELKWNWSEQMNKCIEDKYTHKKKHYFELPIFWRKFIVMLYMTVFSDCHACMQFRRVIFFNVHVLLSVHDVRTLFASHFIFNYTISSVSMKTKRKKWNNTNNNNNDHILWLKKRNGKLKYPLTRAEKKYIIKCTTSPKQKKSLQHSELARYSLE